MSESGKSAQELWDEVVSKISTGAKAPIDRRKLYFDCCSKTFSASATIANKDRVEREFLSEIIDFCNKQHANGYLLLFHGLPEMKTCSDYSTVSFSYKIFYAKPEEIKWYEEFKYSVLEKSGEKMF